MGTETDKRKTREESTNEKLETPCKYCKEKRRCYSMCIDRCYWGVFEADSDNEDLLTYGNERKVGENTYNNGIEENTVDYSIEDIIRLGL